LSKKAKANGPAVQVVRVTDIDFSGRHRKDMGELDALAASIRDVGLLQPVVITKQKKLVAGERRLRAVVQLDWQTVPAYAVKLRRVLSIPAAKHRGEK
jgi:ParB family chromosome partitioning protein